MEATWVRICPTQWIAAASRWPDQCFDLLRQVWQQFTCPEETEGWAGSPNQEAGIRWTRQLVPPSTALPRCLTPPCLLPARTHNSAEQSTLSRDVRWGGFRVKKELFGSKYPWNLRYSSEPRITQQSGMCFPQIFHSTPWSNFQHWNASDGGYSRIMPKSTASYWYIALGTFGHFKKKNW